MPSTGLGGAHTLSAEVIDRLVEKKIGCYALGHTNDNNRFVVQRIGRSDTDLNKRLKDYDGEYSEFKFGYFPTKKAAFEKECELYHDFSPMDNENHPDRPDGLPTIARLLIVTSSSDLICLFTVDKAYYVGEGKVIPKEPTDSLNHFLV